MFFLVSVLSRVSLLAVLSLIDVRWSTRAQESVRISAPERNEDVQECLVNSLQAKLRFEVRLCRKRSGWMDYCKDSRSELHTVTYDEVTESYRFVSDRLNDGQDPIAIEVPDRKDAIQFATTIEALPIQFLTHSDSDMGQHPGAYLQIRTIFKCRGNSSRPFAHISRFLTFGLLNIVEDRSEWRDFILHSAELNG